MSAAFRVGTNRLRSTFVLAAPNLTGVVAVAGITIETEPATTATLAKEPTMNCRLLGILIYPLWNGACGSKRGEDAGPWTLGHPRHDSERDEAIPKNHRLATRALVLISIVYKYSQSAVICYTKRR